MDSDIFRRRNYPGIVAWNRGIVLLSVILKPLSALFTPDTSSDNLRVRASLGHNVRSWYRHGRLEYMDISWRRLTIHWQHHR